MNTKNRASPDHPPAVEPRILGLSIVGGGVAWLSHILLVYLVAEFGCIRGLGEVRFWGITAVAWLLLLATVTALAGGLGATVLSYRVGQTEGGVRDFKDGGESSGSFTARTAFWTNLIFVFVILVESIPIFYYLHDC